MYGENNIRSLFYLLSVLILVIMLIKLSHQLIENYKNSRIEKIIINSIAISRKCHHSNNLSGIDMTCSTTYIYCI